jgi:FkbM family methyltransferase
MKIEYQLIKDGLMIAKRFGIKHAIRRAKDLVSVKKEERRRTKLYNEIKPTGKIIKEVIGSKMRLDMNDQGIHRDLFLDGIREPVATKHLTTIMTKNDVVLDIGANIGYYALLEAKLCKKVYAVEPVPSNIVVLKDNINLNNYKNVEVFSLAFGKTRGTEKMYLSPKSNLHSFYRIKDVAGEATINVDTVDNFLKDKENPTIARMDVEGYELNILCGMKETLKKINRLFIEIHSDIMSSEDTKRLIEILNSEGFASDMIIKYDRPGLSRILPDDYIDKIYKGDKGSYEVFFRKT